MKSMGWFFGCAVLLGAVVPACGDDGGGSGSTASSAAATMMGSGISSEVSSGTATTGSGTSQGTVGTSMATSPTTAGTGDSTSTGSELGTCGNAERQLLLPQMAWNTRVDGAATAADSAAVIGYLQANVQSDARFQIDFSITVLEADSTTERQPFTPSDDYYAGDCDPAPIPIPDGGHIEGEAGYTCDGDGDCHLIVIDRDNCRLYEQWRANYSGPGGFDGGCLAVWELDRAYDETLRGDFCSSADAAGLPIAPLLFTSDEVAAGEIRHALRFILPNDSIRADEYVRPGTHSTGATAGPADAPPYSVRLRLRPEIDLSGLNPAAQIVAVALQDYGMFLADGGNITFTAADDDFMTSTWEEAGLGPHDLKGLQWSDFEVVDAGPTFAWSSGDCTRTPIAD